MKRFIRFVLFRIKKKEKSKADDLFYDSTNLTVGESTVLNSNTRLRFDVAKEKRKYVEIGEKGIISAHFLFESPSGKIVIGNNVHIGFSTMICRNSIIIGNDVTMAWDITLYDHDSHSIYWEERKNDNSQCYEDFLEFKNNVVNKDWSNVKSKPIVLKDKVWIGFGVTILKGVTIGEGAVIGAKSVVTKDIPAWTVAAGNPAKVVKKIN